MDNYVIYHLHSQDSLLDSASSFQEEADLAKSWGMKAIGWSEHGNVNHWFKKWMYCRKIGLKFLFGIEVYLTASTNEKIRDNYHTILIAKNLNGFIELNNAISTAGSLSHMYYKRRMSFDEFFKLSDNVIKISACLASPLNKYPNKNDDIYDRLCKTYDYYEIQYHIGEQEEYNKYLYDLSKKYNKPLIAATDTHSSNKYKSECRMVLKYGKTGGEWGDDENKYDLTQKSYSELCNAFKKQNALPEKIWMAAIEETNKMAESCDELEIDTSLKYPKSYPGQDEEKIMWNRINRMYSEKVEQHIIDGNNPQYMNNIKEEMRVFKKIDMIGFMLFMSELMCWAKEQGLFTSPCRGSVGGSTVAYITDIIDVDPIKWHTVFSRFANESRKEAGDIDTDWYEDDRPLVYQHMFEKFGKRKCAYILAMGTLADKAVIDTIGKAFRVKAEKEGIETPYTLAKIKEIKEEWEKNQENTRKKYPDLFYYYDGLVGCMVSQSRHPAGIVVSPIDLVDNYSVFEDKDGNQILPLDMEDVHESGLLKYDILGLKNVGIIEKICKSANLPLPRSYQINWEDQKVFASMVKSPIGIFQFESSFAYSTLCNYYKNIIASGKNFTIDDMSICNACIRPSGESYRDDLIALHIHKNPSPIIDSLLENTHGFLVFQEQTIAFLQQICGLSGSDADNVRRAIGRKQKDRLEAAMPQILDGYCNKSPEPRSIAENEAKEFLQIIEDSQNYQFGFNHSTGYSMLGFLCAYYRCYYPIEFCTAFLNCSKSEEDIYNGTMLARQLGLTIKSPRFRKAGNEWRFDKQNNTIYKSLKSIKDIGNDTGGSLLALKNFSGTFPELLAAIQEGKLAKKNEVEILIKLNFFEEFGDINQLLYIHKLFKELYGKKNIKRDKVAELAITENTVGKFSQKETATQYTNVDTLALLNYLYNSWNGEKCSLMQKIEYENELLGYISLTDPTMDWHYCLVTGLSTKYTPICTLYCIRNGKQQVMKIKKNKFNDWNLPMVWNDLPLKIGDLIQIKGCGQQFKNKKVNGQWVRSDEKEWILRDYILVKRKPA